MFDLSNLVPILLFLLMSGLAFFGSIYIVFYNSLRSGLVFYSLPWLVLFFSLGAYFFFSKISFGGQMLAGFMEFIVAISVYVLFFLVVAVFAFRLKKFEFFIPILGVILIILLNYFVNLFNRYQDLDSQKFAQRMPDYVSALQSGDLAKIDAMVEKYKSKNIWSFLLIENIQKSDVRSFEHLAEKGLFDSWDLEKYIQKFYGQDPQADQRVFKILIEQSLARKETYFTEKLFNDFFKSHLAMTIPDIESFLNTAKSLQFNKSDLSSYIPGTSNYSGSPGFVVRALSQVESLALDIASKAHGNLEESRFLSDCDKKFFLAEYLWKNREVFVTEEEVKDFAQYITKSARVYNEQNFKEENLSPEKKKQVLYLRKKIEEFESLMR